MKEVLILESKGTLEAHVTGRLKPFAAKTARATRTVELVVLAEPQWRIPRQVAWPRLIGLIAVLLLLTAVIGVTSRQALMQRLKKLEAQLSLWGEAHQSLPV